MTVRWSQYAKLCLRGIIDNIATARSFEDGLRWQEKFLEAVRTLEDFPEIGTAIPDTCFLTLPAADNLRQINCVPYRIVYEIVGDECHILYVQHTRQLINPYFLRWEE